MPQFNRDNNGFLLFVFALKNIPLMSAARFPGVEPPKLVPFMDNRDMDRNKISF